MSKDLLHKILALKTENEVVEFKEAKTQYSKDKLGQYFSALSNEANLMSVDCAWLLFGVTNDRKVVGTSISDVQLNEFKNELAQHTSPRASFENTIRVDENGLEVIMCRIPPAPIGQPVAWKGFCYGRDGESLGPLNQHEYDIIRQQTAADWSAHIIAEATLDDLEPKAIAFAREQYLEKNKHIAKEIDTWDTITFLNKAKVTIKGGITRAAIILLGKPESDHFINPAQAQITWILKDKDNQQRDYAHFGCPLILAVDQVRAKIRNLKYRYITDGTLFPDEVDSFDPYIIRESLHNAIAHQDYTRNGRIDVVEREDGYLFFTNQGTFIPESVEYVVKSNSPESRYRNPFLANAMVNLNMIDTVGSGIRRMFEIQRAKYFPLPDYELEKSKVQLEIVGKVLDMQYASKLAQMPDLTLDEIILLDKVAKHKLINDAEAAILRKKRLIEGRKPNFYVSAKVAEVTGEQAEYIRKKGFDDAHYRDMILKYLETFGEGFKADFERLLIDKLPEVLNEEQKKNKIKNFLQRLHREGKISGGYKQAWRLSK
jgi:ATP-dependent DNA helicase RecG